MLLMLQGATAQKATVEFKGMCDASGAIWVGKRLLVINDEDQDRTLLRLFDVTTGGAPVSSIELSPAALQFDPKEPELDLEAIAAADAQFWAIGSHSRNKSGLSRWSRQNLISFRWGSAGPLNVRSISTLLPALAIRARQADKDTRDLDAPKDPKDGGLSIEGLAAMPSGDLLIGLRSPLDSRGRAYVARLKTPAAAVVGNRVLQNLDKMFLLAIDGGIRDLIYDPPDKRYLILSGSVGDGGPFGIWSWAGDDSQPTQLLDISALIPANTAPEGLVRAGTGEGFWILLDEGQRLVEPKLECKDAPTDRQSFRAILIANLP